MATKTTIKQQWGGNEQIWGLQIDSLDITIYHRIWGLKRDSGILQAKPFNPLV